MKTERIIFLTEPHFKAHLQHQAEVECISVGELIRRQFEYQTRTDESEALQAAAEQIKQAVDTTRLAIASANKELAETLAYFRD